MDLDEIPRVPLLVGLLILALVAGVAGYSYINNDSSQQIATPAPAAQEPLTDEQMKENLENPTLDMNETADDVLDSESVDSGTVYEGSSSHTTSKKTVSAVAVVKKPKTTAHPSKPVKPQNPTNPTNTNPTNPNEPQNPQPGQGDEGYYSDEP